jgi:excinuclease Cho
VERSASDNQLHVIHNWTYLGSVSEAAQAKALTTQAPGFDADGYKILCKPILGGSAEIVLL